MHIYDYLIHKYFNQKNEPFSFIIISPNLGVSILYIYFNMILQSFVTCGSCGKVAISKQLRDKLW